MVPSLAYKVLTVSAYIQNIFLHSSIKFKTPFEYYNVHNIDVSNIMVFRSTACARIPLDKRKYLEPQSIERKLTGYTEEYKGYKLMDIIFKNIFIDKSVRFE